MKYANIKAESWNQRNQNALNRKTGQRRVSDAERAIVESSPDYAPHKSGDYLFANCVVLAAAIFNEAWAYKWATDLLPSARQLDMRQSNGQLLR